MVNESLLFLEGRNTELVERLNERMLAEAEAEEFEKAARIRDTIRAIAATIEHQDVVDSRRRDRDIWGLHRVGSQASIVLLPVRHGRMQEAIQLAVEHHPGTDEELLSTTINLWYADSAERPPELLLPLLPSDSEGLSEVLSERAGKKVKLRVPQRGTDRRWLGIAQDNARVDFDRRVSGEEQRLMALQRLREVAHLSRLPSRIECFDNSNIQGSDPVAAMAVYRHGQPDRSQYRRYHVKTVVGADDFASMAEILERRLRRGLLDEELPDLIIVDGGKGQLSAARNVLNLLGIRDQTQPDGPGPLVDIIGVSKPRVEHARGNRSATDRLVLPDIKNPIVLKTTDPALRLVQSIRDEAHSTAVKFHRKRRRTTRLGSQIDGLSGVGPSRRKALLRHFGSVAEMKKATLEDFLLVPGIGPRLAKELVAVLHIEDDGAS